MGEANEKPTNDPFQPGRTLNERYRIEAKLGAGGMGTVFRGTHLFMERPVAIKVLHAHLNDNQDFIQRFLHEARVNCKIAHRNAVTLYDFGVVGPTPYLVFEFVEGLTLREVLLADGRFSTERFLNIITQVGAALAHAHSLGIVHRDLKPDNIMIAHRGGMTNEYACVLDFGIAKALHVTPGEERTVVTKMGMVMGTPQYLSPEQALEKELDGRSDIYSLGIIMYEMLTGEVPFHTPSSPLEILVQHLNALPTPLRTLKPELNIPAPIADVVMKCLKKLPEERFQSVDELLDALSKAWAESERAREKQPFIGKKAPAAKSPKDSSKKSASGLIVAGMVAIAIIGAATMYAAQDQTPAPAGDQSQPAPESPPTSPAAATNDPALEPPPLQPEARTEVAPPSVNEPVTVVEAPAAESERMFGAPVLALSALDAVEQFSADFPELQTVPPEEPRPENNSTARAFGETSTIEPGSAAANAPVDETKLETLTPEPGKIVEQNLIAERVREPAEAPVAPEKVEASLPPAPETPPSAEAEKNAATAELNPDIAALATEDIPIKSISRELTERQFESSMAAAKKVLQKKDYLGAARLYAPLVRARGDNLNARLSYGTCLLKLHAYDAAAREFQRALEIEPQFAPALYMLGAYHAAKNEPEKALELLGKAFKLFPGAKKWLSEDEEFSSLRQSESLRALLNAK